MINEDDTFHCLLNKIEKQGDKIIEQDNELDKLKHNVCVNKKSIVNIYKYIHKFVDIAEEIK